MYQLKEIAQKNSPPDDKATAQGWQSKKNNLTNYICFQTARFVILFALKKGLFKFFFIFKSNISK